MVGKNSFPLLLCAKYIYMNTAPTHAGKDHHVIYTALSNTYTTHYTSKGILYPTNTILIAYPIITLIEYFI